MDMCIANRVSVALARRAWRQAACGSLALLLLSAAAGLLRGQETADAAVTSRSGFRVV